MSHAVFIYVRNFGVFVDMSSNTNFDTLCKAFLYLIFAFDSVEGVDHLITNLHLLVLAAM